MVPQVLALKDQGHNAVHVTGVRFAQAVPLMQRMSRWIAPVGHSVDPSEFSFATVKSVTAEIFFFNYPDPDFSSME